jgi:ABC-type lipoprotein export system ATPase subunit
VTSWLVETKGLRRVFGDGTPITALDNVSIRIAAGELVAVMGPSGSGKSTLLNQIGALDKPSSGEVIVAGQSLQTLKDVDAFRARTVGFIFQLHNLLPTLTARENVDVPMMGHVPAAQRRARSEELLALVGLADRMHHLPNQLSGGERQRVAVARALANNPPLVLADEPTGSLDTRAGRELMNLLKSLNKEGGTTFIVVTHDPAVARQTQRVLVMEDGRIVRQDQIGSPLEEDLRLWRHSELGEHIMADDERVRSQLDLTRGQLEALRGVLRQANQTGVEVKAG